MGGSHLYRGGGGWVVKGGACSGEKPRKLARGTNPQVGFKKSIWPLSAVLCSGKRKVGAEFKWKKEISHI